MLDEEALVAEVLDLDLDLDLWVLDEGGLVVASVWDVDVVVGGAVLDEEVVDDGGPPVPSVWDVEVVEVDEFEVSPKCGSGPIQPQLMGMMPFSFWPRASKAAGLRSRWLASHSGHMSTISTVIAVWLLLTLSLWPQTTLVSLPG